MCKVFFKVIKNKYYCSMKKHYIPILTRVTYIKKRTSRI